MATSNFNSALGKRESLKKGSPARWIAREDPGAHASSSSYRIKLGTWNVRTLNEPGALRCVLQEMEHMDLDLLGIAETHWPDRRDFRTQSPKSKANYRVIHSGGEQRDFGVALILNDRMSNALKYFVFVSKRIIYAKFTEQLHDTLLIQAYAPTAEHPVEEIEQFYDDLSEIINTKKAWKDKLLVVGDFNAKVGKEREGGIVGPFGLGERDNSGSLLIEFCKKHNLFITNTWFEQKESARYTWKSPGDRYRNQIDFVLCNQRYRNSILNSKVRHGVDFWSDHEPVIITSQTRLKSITRSPAKIHPEKWNLARLTDKDCKFAETCDEKFKSIPTEHMDPEQRWNNIKTTIKETADETVGKKKQEAKQHWMTTEGKKTHEAKQHWMTTEILDMMEERRKKKDLMTPEKYREMCHNIQRECRKAKEDYYDRKCSEIESLDKCHSNKKYEKTKKLKKPSGKVNLGIKDKDGKLLQDDADILNRWTQYIGEDLFNDERPEKPSIDVSDNLAEITTSEVVKAISHLARNKSPGEDELPAELLQALGTSGKEEITTLINDIYKTGVIPKDFTSGVFVALSKVNRATNCSDYRIISLISHASKILLRVIMNRINPIIDKHLDDTQLGFRKGKGTRDGIFLLRNTCERMMDIKKDLYLCFVDYAKAFDRVNHEKLMEVLAKAGIPSHERRLGKIEGKRGPGRPKRNWMDDVKEWSSSKSYGDTKRKAENREEWRDMIANLETEDGT
ncbi:endonuclease-reverse transcriptase [Elysia marginata]|uniref:Endonuclease-reverse transcriptase n=1 Tax=Elysia marginata TaxID=1093978 RepID=A0AAV4HXL3_9GAST|nr:endonuclease-reverse transcriptase [Elysia marginata]